MIFLSQDSEGGKPNQSSGQLCRTAVGGRILRRKRVLSHLKAAFPCPLNMVWMDPLLWKSTSHGFEIGSLAGITDLALASQECPHSWHESPWPPLSVVLGLRCSCYPTNSSPAGLSISHPTGNFLQSSTMPCPCREDLSSNPQILFYCRIGRFHWWEWEK